LGDTAFVVSVVELAPRAAETKSTASHASSRLITRSAYWTDAVRPRIVGLGSRDELRD